MSSNVDLLKAVHEGWSRGDFSGDDWADPEIVFDLSDLPGGSSGVGFEGLAKGFRSYFSVFEDARAIADQFRELDDERVLVIYRLGGRAKASGVELTKLGGRSANVFHLRHGKVTRITAWFDARRALADLGLPPDDGA